MKKKYKIKIINKNNKEIKKRKRTGGERGTEERIFAKSPKKE